MVQINTEHFTMNAWTSALANLPLFMCVSDREPQRNLAVPGRTPRPGAEPFPKPWWPQPLSFQSGVEWGDPEQCLMFHIHLTIGMLAISLKDPVHILLHVLSSCDQVLTFPQLVSLALSTYIPCFTFCSQARCEAQYYVYKQHLVLHTVACPKQLLFCREREKSRVLCSRKYFWLNIDQLHRRFLLIQFQINLWKHIYMEYKVLPRRQYYEKPHGMWNNIMQIAISEIQQVYFCQFVRFTCVCTVSFTL